MHKIATLINFSSNEAAFLKPCLEEVLPFSAQVIVSVCDHFFDGVEENKELLSKIYAEFSNVQFIQFEFQKEKNLYGAHSAHFWHNLGRLLGFYHVNSEIEYLLFLDVDEIIERKRFEEWLKDFPLNNYAALRLACYWYFRAEKYQAKYWEDTPLLAKKSVLNHDILMNGLERAGSYSQIYGKKERHIKGKDHLPMVHHYSWVRTKEQMLRKVVSWGHREERDWVALVEKEFSAPFKGKDFVHGYEFTEVKPYIKLKKRISYLDQKWDNRNVCFLSTRDMNKIDLALKFDI